MLKANQYNVAITLLPGVGAVTAKNLIAYCGSSEAVFAEKRKGLEKIPSVGKVLVDTLSNEEVKKKALDRADVEMKFIEQQNITPHFFMDSDYPRRLKECADSPLMIYKRGNIDLNPEKIVNIVGSRKASAYGKKICEQVIEAFAPYNVLIVSGLAYGIDITAHRASIKNKLPTVAVLAHGLDTLYPAEHRETAEKMQENGAVLTEFISQTKITPEYFPRRNRIVAGMTDATIVIEATHKSGALITAEIANSYNRDVFVVPGRVDDSSSEGCNLLIKLNKGMLIQSAYDIIAALNWDISKKETKQTQHKLFVQLSVEEETIMGILRGKQKTHIDELSIASKLPMSKTTAILLNLEFSGIINSLPGKLYELNN